MEGILKLLIVCCLIFGLFSDTSHETDQDLQLVHRIQQNELRLIVMRHGEATNNAQHFMSSSYDTEVKLTEEGVEQVKVAAKALVNEKIDWIYVSPMYRSIQTAQILCRDLGIPENKIIVNDDIGEQYFGDLENCHSNDYLNQFKSLKHVFTEAAPGGESGKDVSKRTNKFLHLLTTRHFQETILVITHAFNYCHISNNLLGFIEEFPELAQFKIYPFAYNVELPLEYVE